MIRRHIDKDIAEAFPENGKFGKSDIMELFPSLSNSSIEASLKSLCAEGFIEKWDRGRSTFYVRKD